MVLLNHWEKINWKQAKSNILLSKNIKQKKVKFPIPLLNEIRASPPWPSVLSFFGSVVYSTVILYFTTKTHVQVNTDHVYLSGFRIFSSSINLQPIATLMMSLFLIAEYYLFHCVNEPHCLYAVFSWWTCGLFPSVAIMNKAALNIVEQVSCGMVVVLLGICPRAVSWGRSIPSFLKNHQSYFQSSCTSLDSHQSVPLVPHPPQHELLLEVYFFFLLFVF